MIIIMKPDASQEAIAKITSLVEANGLQVHLSRGSEVTIVGVVGDKTKLNGANLEIADGVEKIVAVTESYKLANKKFHPDDSVIRVGNTTIGSADADCFRSQKSRRDLSSRRCLQTTYFSIFLPGTGGRGSSLHERSQRSYRSECDL